MSSSLPLRLRTAARHHRRTLPALARRVRHRRWLLALLAVGRRLRTSDRRRAPGLRPTRSPLPSRHCVGGGFAPVRPIALGAAALRIALLRDTLLFFLQRLVEVAERIVEALSAAERLRSSDVCAPPPGPSVEWRCRRSSPFAILPDFAFDFGSESPSPLAARAVAVFTDSPGRPEATRKKGKLRPETRHAGAAARHSPACRCCHPAFRRRRRACRRCRPPGIPPPPLGMPPPPPPPEGLGIPPPPPPLLPPDDAQPARIVAATAIAIRFKGVRMRNLLR